MGAVRPTCEVTWTWEGNGVLDELDALAQVDRAELSLKQRGYRELRVRHFGELGRVQLGAADLPRAADPAEHAALLACVRAAGYQRAEIDERPLRSGSLNLDITPVRRAG